MNSRIPEDIESERSLLATLGASGTLDPGSENADAHQAVLDMRPEFFIHRGHQAVCKAIQAIYAEGGDFSSITLKAKLEAQGTLHRINGLTGLIELLGAEEVHRPTALVTRLADLWRARQIIRLGATAQRLGQDPMEPVADVISALATELSNLQTGATAIRLRKGTAILDKLVSGLAFRDPIHGGAKLVRFGLDVMDEVLEASAGHVITIGARPGVGKTALQVQGAWKTAQAGQRPFLASLELDEDEVDARLAAWKTGVPYKVFREGTWNAQAVTDMIGEAATLERITTWSHASGVAWATIEAAIRDAVRVEGSTSAWIDHALLVGKPVLGKNTTDAAAWASLSHAIKRLAQELRICIVVLIQLNRVNAVGEPNLSDLKESGAWEEDANAVFLLWDKNQASEEGALAETKEVYVKAAKMRSGASGWKRLLEFRGALNRFRVFVNETEGTSSDGVPIGVQGRFHM
jgi:replicative DNA helicase